MNRDNHSGDKKARGDVIAIATATTSNAIVARTGQRKRRATLGRVHHSMVRSRSYLSQHTSAREVDKKSSQGALLEIQWEKGVHGVCDIMSHPQFHEENVDNYVESVHQLPESTLKSLWQLFSDVSATTFVQVLELQKRFSTVIKSFEIPELVGAALFNAALDAHSRQNKIPLLRDLEIPKSHALLNVAEFSTYEELSQKILDCAKRGFAAVKLKCPGSAEQRYQLLRWIALLDQSPVPLRLDFGLATRWTELLKIIQNLPSREGWKWVEFIEDPCVYNSERWAKLRTMGLPLANDFACSETPPEAQFTILKPSRQLVVNHFKVSENSSKPHCYCITHNMDHELGRRVAAYWAAHLQKQFPNQMVAPGLCDDLSSPSFGIQASPTKCLNGEDFGFGMSLLF